ncbi:MAG: flagellar biosynthesis anti-sigma factor FlgM [Erysipelothrix sp.]|nr:flagellar biosynthesis anti-sigma factor FlgM [Erysipelothrix sp.]
MKINPNKITTPIVKSTKTQSFKDKSIKEGMTDKLELSAKAKEALQLHDAKTKINSKIEEQFSSKRVEEVKAQIQNKTYKIDHEKLTQALLDAFTSVKGK